MRRTWGYDVRYKTNPNGVLFVGSHRSLTFAYSIQVAELLTQQLAKFVTLRPYQLAGHVANLGFWLNEVRHAIAVINDYKPRYERMQAAQQASLIATHPNRARPYTVRVSIDELNTAKRELYDALYRVVARLFRESLVSEKQLYEICAEFDISIDVRDLR